MCSTTQNIVSDKHALNNGWTLWAHLPHDVNWDVKSYKKIHTVENVEDAVVLFHALPENLIKNCMLFIMRDGILPIWEDKKNSRGGCFSYKVNNKTIMKTWTELAHKLIGETLISDENNVEKINGITISPKRSFCIIKIWTTDHSIQNPQIISDIDGLPKQGCIFKKHNPNF
jgi:hypothetical protein